MLRARCSTPRVDAEGSAGCARPLTASLTSALCLALGIAARRVAVDAARRRHPPARSDSTAAIGWSSSGKPIRRGGRHLIEVSHLNFLDWQRESRTVDRWRRSARRIGRRSRGSAVTPCRSRRAPSPPSFFATLGVSPALGRDFARDGSARPQRAAAGDPQPSPLANAIRRHADGCRPDAVHRRRPTTTSSA